MYLSGIEGRLFRIYVHLAGQKMKKIEFFIYTHFINLIRGMKYRVRKNELVNALRRMRND